MGYRRHSKFYRCHYLCRDRFTLSRCGWFLQDILALLPPILCLHGQLDSGHQQCRRHRQRRYYGRRIHRPRITTLRRSWHRYQDHHTCICPCALYHQYDRHQGQRQIPQRPHDHQDQHVAVIDRRCLFCSWPACA